MNDLDVSALTALLGDHDYVLTDGLAGDIASWQEIPRLRGSHLMGAASRLRAILQDLPAETDSEAKVEILAVDAAVLLDLLLRRIG